MYVYAKNRVSGGFLCKGWTPCTFKSVWMSMLKFKSWKLSNGKVMNQIIQSVDIKNACVSKKCSSLFSQMYDKSVSWMEKKASKHILWLAWIQFLKVEWIASTSQHKNSILIFSKQKLDRKEGPFCCDLLKVSSFQNVLMKNQFHPKYQRKYFWNSDLKELFF